MERFLDIIWLSLFLTSFPLWHRRRSDHGFARSLLVIICLFVLLFPVISASDDLCAAAVNFEEITPAKKVYKASSAAKSGTHHAPVYMVAENTWQHGTSCPLCNLPPFSIARFPSAVSCDAISGRAPPTACA